MSTQTPGVFERFVPTSDQFDHIRAASPKYGPCPAKFGARPARFGPCRPNSDYVRPNSGRVRPNSGRFDELRDVFIQIRGVLDQIRAASTQFGALLAKLGERISKFEPFRPISECVRLNSGPFNRTEDCLNQTGAKFNMLVGSSTAGWCNQSACDTVTLHSFRNDCKNERCADGVHLVLQQRRS